MTSDSKFDLKITIWPHYRNLTSRSKFPLKNKSNLELENWNLQCLSLTVFRKMRNLLRNQLISIKKKLTYNFELIQWHEFFWWILIFDVFSFLFYWVEIIFFIFIWIVDDWSSFNMNYRIWDISESWEVTPISRFFLSPI